MVGKTSIEIAVQDRIGAEIAARLGADRIELCAALHATGGISPTAAVIRSCSRIVETHVLVRPRPGGFVYAPHEVDVMVEEVSDSVAAGAAGVVIGAATAGGELDAEVLRRLVDAAGSAHVTLHRVFDVVPDHAAALAVCRDVGITRVLTSGGFPNAPEGAEVLGELVAQAQGVDIMAGGGITPNTVDRLRTSGVAAVHASCSKLVPTGPAGPGGGDSVLQVTDEDAVAALVAAVARWAA